MAATASEVATMIRFVLLALCLSLAGVALVRAARPPVAAPASPAIRHVADGDFDTGKDRYVAQAREEMAEWRRKLDRLADKAGEHTAATGEAAHQDLDRAWQRAKVEEGRLEVASHEGWGKLKESYEKASQNLKETWDRQSAGH
jgi:hypothetical protein